MAVFFRGLHISTLTFVSNLATGDVIDFVILLGNVLDLGTPSDGTVSTAKIATDAVTNAKIGAAAVNTTELGTGIDLTGKFAWIDGQWNASSVGM